MQAKLIGHQHRDTVIHHLSGAGKLLFSFSYHWRPWLAMIPDCLFWLPSFRYFSSICQRSALKMFPLWPFCDGICRFKRLDGLSLFSPSMGLDFTERSVIWQGIGAYTLTSQELFYLLNLAIKYLCTIPLAIIFWWQPTLVSLLPV